MFGASGRGRRVDWIGLAVFDAASSAWLLVIRRRFIPAAP
jgi:hypothetical protein